MHFAFIDIAYDYTVDRPDTAAPLGGTTTALCFLTRALRQAGHDCTLFNKVTSPASAHGITSYPLEALTTERSNPAYTAFIFCGRWTEWLVQHIAEASTVPLIAWMHESRFGLHLVPTLPQFHHVIFVSVWQAAINQASLFSHQTHDIIRNAINPAIAALFPPHHPITHLKKPQAVYIGSTPRGLLHLPRLWPVLHQSCPELTLQIYANPALSRDQTENAAFTEQLSSMAGVSHIGMVGQPELAQALHQASFYLGPNPYPETSCIALMEALAAGLCCFTTHRAALPETAAGFAQLCPISHPDDPDIFTQPFDYAAFIDRTLPIIRDRLAHPEQWETRLRQQVDHFQITGQWGDRATEWAQVCAKLNALLTKLN